ncbi:uncharacterized protein LOC122568300 [Bombus pyrosoma]|uniref:uncharacterized protein LOC122568300 n=1 Tax=Bombus pyrosoma TaxID=396416 RepID=UPI001CB9516A|nr:uncharacterized protein LOC122568300 [Bombus pyrosoma]
MKPTRKGGGERTTSWREHPMVHDGENTQRHKESVVPVHQSRNGRKQPAGQYNRVLSVLFVLSDQLLPATQRCFHFPSTRKRTTFALPHVLPFFMQTGSSLISFLACKSIHDDVIRRGTSFLLLCERFVIYDG